jgi:hypothetical protein
MTLKTRGLTTLLAGAALAAPLLVAGCGGHAGVRVYDPYYSDYHTWNNGEVVYYKQWNNDTHRHYVEYRNLPEKDQHEYWDWRHNHH